MTESNTPVPTPPEPTLTPPKKKKRRLLLKSVGVLMVLGVLLVVFLPTILSLAPMRSLIVSQANGYLNGKAEVASWSLGWFSPIRVEGVRVFDSKNAQVLELTKLETEATLLSLARQNFNLGKTTIIADATNVVVYPNGRSNLHDVFKLPAPGAPTAPKTPEPKTPAGETKIPDVKIDLTLDLRGGIQLVDESGKSVTRVELRQGSGGTVKIDDINAGVAPDLKLIYDVDGGAPSTVTITGTADAVENNSLDLPNLAAKIKLALANVDLGAAKPLLAMAGVKDIEIAGLANGEINADLQKGESGGAKGELQVATFAFAMPAIPDKYKAELIRLPIDVSRGVEGGASRLKVNIQAIAPEVTAAIVGDLPESAIDRLKANQMPGADGTLSVTVNADPAKAAASFPNTLKLLPGVTVQQGKLFAQVDLWLKPESIVYGVNANVNVSGTQNGKNIAIEPVTLATAGTLTSLADPVRGLRALSVDINSQSKFIAFKGGGASVTDLQGAGEANLDLLRNQLAQFADLSGVELAGKAVFSLRNQLTDEAKKQYAFDLGSTLTGIKARLKGVPPIDLQFVKVGVSSQYVLSDDPADPVQSIGVATASLLVGPSEDKPLVDALVNVTDIDPKAQTIGAFKVERGTITDVQALQKLIDPFVPQLRENQIELRRGAIYFSTAGKADMVKRTITLDQLDASTPSLIVFMKGQELLNDRFVVTLAGAIAQGEKIELALSKLSVKSELVTLSQQGEQLRVVLGEGLPQGSGKLDLLLNFIPLNRVMRALSPEPMNTISGGQLAGTLTFANDAGKPAVGFAGDIKGLTIDQTAVANESLAIMLNAVTTEKLDSASVSANVKGSFLSLNAKDTSVNFAKGTPLLKMVEKAMVTIGIPDAQKAVAVAKSLVPNLDLPYTPAGGVAISATVAGSKADLDIKASRLTLADKTGKIYRFDPKKPISIVASVDIVGADKIERITVTKLEGDLDVAQIAMLEPIVVDDPMGRMSPKGKVRVSGSLDRVTPLVQFLQAAEKPLPYKGMFEINPTLSASGSVVTALLDGTVRDFSMIDDAGKTTFTEKEIKIAGDISADLDQKIATIRSLNVDMASSKAATINVTGAIEKFDTAAPILRQVVAKIDAKGEQAWPLIFPMLPPDQQEKLQSAKIAGPITFDITANGSYLTDKELHEAIQPLLARGQVTIASADLSQSYGIDVKNLQQFFTIENKGQLITGHRNDAGKWAFAPAFDINGGKGSFGSVVVELGHPDMLVSVGRKQKILTGVRLNHVMAAQLGSLASVMFKDSKQASGIVDVIVMECDRVPMADLMSGSDKAKATILYNVKNLRLDGAVPSALSGILQWGDQGIVGNIENGSLVLSDGIAYQDMTINLLKMVDERDPKTGDRKQVEVFEQLQFKGGINLAKQRFQDYSLWMSKGLLLADWRKSFPNGATVELRGDVADVNSILAQTIGTLAVQGYGGSLIDDLLGGNKKKKDR